MRAVVQPAALLMCFALAQPAWAEEEVRIALSMGAPRIRIQADDLRVFDADVGDRLAKGGKGVELLVIPVSGGVQFQGNTVPKKGRARRAFFESEHGVRVDGRLYLGRISIHRDKKGRLAVINRLPLETYLLGIVGSEMNPDWPKEALKAQAVAARTYAMQRRMRKRAANKPYDLESSVLSQVYKGADRIRASVVDAVEATRGQVLSHNHRLVEALYHSTCGGETVAAGEAFGKDIPYLRPRRCKWCKASKVYRWKAEIPLSDLQRKLQAARLIRGKLKSFDRGRNDDGVRVKAGGGTKSLDPRTVRKAVGYVRMRSSRFEAKTSGSTVKITGRGFGHGVGMCQWGAHGLSSEGRNYREILGHYYKGAEVKRIY